jgi:membrane protease YdiL (CAAX protease family)
VPEDGRPMTDDKKHIKRRIIPVSGLLYAIVPLLVLLVATFLACILAYFLVLVWDDELSFRTIIRKSTQLFLVLSIFPAMHYLKLNKFDLGFSVRPVFFKQLWQGAGLGFITLLPVFIVLYLLDVNVVDESKPWTLFWVSKKLGIELLLALLISLFEEPVFRGILIAGLRKKMSVWAAILISAFYYAILHFLDSKTQIPTREFDFFSGFKLLAEAFAHLLNPEILSAFFALFAVGVFLGVLRTQVNASLGLCIGCHACWVWQIKLSKDLFNINPSSDYLYLVSSYDGVIGPLVTTWLVLAMIVYYLYRRSSDR